MKLPIIYHPVFPRDLRKILTYLERESSSSLADSFFEEMLATVARIEANPRYFPCYRGDVRRANLDRFQYHLLYRIRPNCVRILMILHDRRDPRLGTKRF